MKEKAFKLNVPEDVVPCRIDIYLVQCGVGLSRSQIQKLIRSGRIRVVGKGTKPNFILRGGEVIEVEIPQEEPFALLPEDIPIDIIYEDEHLLVVNKPAGMVTHPARGNWSGTLLNAILFHTEKISPIGGDFRPGIVHRLDKDTSGLLIIAKRASVHIKLSEMLTRREIQRTYIALIWGHLSDDEVLVDAPIGHHPREPIKRAVVAGGRPAKTVFQTESRFDFTDLVKVKLLTGRTHQIRVHAQYIGHPVFGDPDYGGREQRIGGIAPEFRQTARELLKIAQRQMLHAQKLSFTHPVLGKEMEFIAPLPDDFKEVLEKIGLTDPPAS